MVRLFVALLGVHLFAFCDKAEAGPGGQFVKQVLSTKFDKISGIIVGGLLLLAAINLYPLILCGTTCETAGIRRSKRDLAQLATKYPWFEWLTIRNR